MTGRRALWLLTLLLAASLVASAAAADGWYGHGYGGYGICVKPGGGGGCKATIQEGVDAAGEYETVQIYPGVYNENVTIPSGKDGLTLKGSSGVILDPDALDPTNPLSGIGIIVESSHVTLKEFTIRNGQDDHIEIDSATQGTTV